MSPNKNEISLAIRRLRIWYGALVLIIIIFGIRLFYVQIIKYDHYHAAALSDQLKQYQIPATRGLIEAEDGNSVVPIVLNQELFTLYADPTLVKNPTSSAQHIQQIIGGDVTQIAQAMKTKQTRYVVLAKMLTQDQSNSLLALKLPGVGTQGQDYRTYPQGTLASQVLGFVNGNGVGEYGLEQDLNPILAGTPGEVKAVTDANGVPLAASKENVQIPPKNGDDVVTTIDLPMQAKMEQILAQDYQSTQSQQLSAIIIDPDNGQIKAMANYPTYDPSNFENVTNPTLFQNAAVDDPIEPGSTMKIMTTAAALNLGVITPNESFYDPAHWVIDGFNITDIEQDGGPREQTIASLLNLSLNTGATWELMQMGGGQIDAQARNNWYNYMVNHFNLGNLTGVEQGYESPGLVPSPVDNGNGIDLTYANTAFGQGVDVTALQMAAADSSILNGGTYYRPTLVAETIQPNGKVIPNPPKVLIHNTVAPKVGQDMIGLMEYVVQQHLLDGFPYLNFSSDYIVGGKTGTAQIAQPGGGYYANKYNGTYVGFVGGNSPQYLIVVYNIQPNVPGYAGTYGGQPVFSDLAHMLINNSYVTPKSN